MADRRGRPVQRLTRGADGPGDTCDRLITQLHNERYGDILKYLVLHPTANGKLGAKAEHPMSTRWLCGEGSTWAEALADLLRQVEAIASEDDSRAG